MINDQSYTWTYIGFLPIKENDDIAEWKKVLSSCELFMCDYEAVENALGYKVNLAQYKQYTSIQLFLVMINRHEESIVEYIMSC
jgi:hypothetical protein